MGGFQDGSHLPVSSHSKARTVGKVGDGDTFGSISVGIDPWNSEGVPKSLFWIAGELISAMISSTSVAVKSKSPFASRKIG